MCPVKANDKDRERGKRLQAWLEKEFPGMPKIRIAEDILGVRRQSLDNWLIGADMNNEVIGRILEISGAKALAEILGVKLNCSAGMKSSAGDGKPHVFGEGVRFWYATYIAERMKTVVEEKRDYAALDPTRRYALIRADELAERKEIWRRNEQPS